MTPDRHGSSVIEFPSDLEIVTTREFDVPLALVFDVLTKTKHVRVSSTGHRNAWSSIAAGVWYPSVLRGRVLSRSAIWSRSCCVWCDKSVRRGRY